MTFILGIIPARGGSKGIVNKNIRLINGKPLIAYTIEAAKGSALLSDFVLSTDSEQIVKCAAGFGVMPTALRPAELATDSAKSIDVAIYEVDNYERIHKIRVDVIVLLQPTAPMRQSKDIDDALKLFFQRGASSMISVYEATSEHPNVMYELKNETLSPLLASGLTPTRRQEFTPVFVRNGALYIISSDVLRMQKTFLTSNPVPYVMPKNRSVNIDEPLDLEMAEWMIKRRE